MLEEADVDTVGGLLAQQLGRVPLPGAEVEVAGLHLLAEGGKDARGRVRITTVLITPAHDDSGPAPENRAPANGAPENGQNGASGASDAPTAAFAPSDRGLPENAAEIAPETRLSEPR